MVVIEKLKFEKTDNLSKLIGEEKKICNVIRAYQSEEWSAKSARNSCREVMDYGKRWTNMELDIEMLHTNYKLLKIRHDDICDYIKELNVMLHSHRELIYKRKGDAGMMFFKKGDIVDDIPEDRIYGKEGFANYVSGISGTESFEILRVNKQSITIEGLIAGVMTKGYLKRNTIYRFLTEYDISDMETLSVTLDREEKLNDLLV